MGDKESRDILRKEQRTPKKLSGKPKKDPSTPSRASEEDKENLVTTEPGEPLHNKVRKGLNLDDDPNLKGKAGTDGSQDYEHPVYKQISLKNGFINRQDLSTLKRLCKEVNIDSSGKKDVVSRRLKQYYKAAMLADADILDSPAFRGFDFLVIVDFEATCEDKGPTTLRQEIIEFPAVLVDVKKRKIVDTWRRFVKPSMMPILTEFCVSLTGITQEMVDEAATFPVVLDEFSTWLEEKELGSQHTFAIVTDGPFDVGRFLLVTCDLNSLPVPEWATRWMNVRKSFSNYYKTNEGTGKKNPGLQVMLQKVGLEFQGTPHCGLDDATNIARVVVRMLNDGAVPRVNERLKSVCNSDDNEKDCTFRRLANVRPVTKKEAEDWLRTCRDRLNKVKA